MAYTQNEKSTGLDSLTDLTLVQGDLHIVGDVSDSGRAKTITENLLEDYIANSANFVDELVANNYFTTELANDSNFLTQISTNYVDASTTVKGVVEEATQAETNAGTAVGATGARLFVNPSTLSAAIGAALTYKSGIATYNTATASGVQNIPHGLGTTPARVRLTGQFADPEGIAVSCGTYNGVTNYSVYSDFMGGNNGHTTASNTEGIYFRTSNSGTEHAASGVITFDATNIIITWTKINLPTGIASILFEAYT